MRRTRPDVILEPTYLREWRVYRDKTLWEVGAKIGIDKSALGRIETRESPYDQIHMQLLSKEYGVTIPDLLYTDPKRQHLPNRFGTVGFPQAGKGLEKRARNVRRAATKQPLPEQPAVQRFDKLKPTAIMDDLMSMIMKIRTPEEIDTMKMLLEAMIAKRKEKGGADE